LPRCEADSSQIRQILINLITNASDALGDEPGTITLSTGLIQADRAYLSRAWLDEDLPAGPYVWLEVSDTGIGMPPETQNHMFDPFFTTKPRGHGLGLSATLGVVRGHRGAIRVYSERGHGTTIKVLFPAIFDGREVTTETKVDPERDARRGGVMVVDDEAEIREFASDVLKELGYTVFTAFDGEDAVALFRLRHAEIDGVLLDMTMPRLSGEETFRALRAIRADVKVMLSSGYNEQDATSRFAGRGLAGFLQKPYTASQLLESVSVLMRGTR
jgi:CheY-like chemotaxis protein